MPALMGGTHLFINPKKNNIIFYYTYAHILIICRMFVLNLNGFIKQSNIGTANKQYKMLIILYTIH